jgi:hypothetical protein
MSAQSNHLCRPRRERLTFHRIYEAARESCASHLQEKAVSAILLRRLICGRPGSRHIACLLGTIESTCLRRLQQVTQNHVRRPFGDDAPLASLAIPA